MIERHMGYSQGLGTINFERDDKIRERFKKAELLDKVMLIVSPPIVGEVYTDTIKKRYWCIRELLYPEEPQEIHV